MNKTSRFLAGLHSFSLACANARACHITIDLDELNRKKAEQLETHLIQLIELAIWELNCFPIVIALAIN